MSQKRQAQDITEGPTSPPSAKRTKLSGYVGHTSSSSPLGLDRGVGSSTSAGLFDEGDSLILSTRYRKNKKGVFSDLLCSSTATFAQLDDFIRSRWLDYDHLSVFVREGEWGREYELPIKPGHFCGGSSSLDEKLSTLTVGEELGYVYDFGSPTELIFTLKMRSDMTPEAPVTELRDDEIGLPTIATEDGGVAVSIQGIEVPNESGALDEEWPALSKALRCQAVLTIGRPPKNGNPYITRAEPFYCSVQDEGGWYGSSPVANGAHSALEVGAVLDEAEDVTEGHWGGGGDVAEASYGATFVQRFPRVCKFLTTGKNYIEVGHQMGNFLIVHKGKNVLLATRAVTYLEPAFVVVERFLSPKKRGPAKKTA